MTTQNQVFEPLATQIEAQADAPEAQEAVKEETPDYKAMYEEAHAERLKLQNDAKAQRTSRMKQEERDTMMANIWDELSALRKENQALLRSRAAEDEELGKEIGRIQHEAGQAKQGQTLYQQYATKKAKFIELATLQDDQGHPLFSPGAPEIIEASEVFNSGVAEKPMTSEQRNGYWNDAIEMVQKAVSVRERAILKKAREETVEAVKTARKNALEESGALDLDVGTGAGGGEVTPENIDVLWLEYDLKNPGRTNPYEKQYRELLGLAN